METTNSDEGTNMEVMKNDEGTRKKTKVVNTANLKDILLSRINIFRKIKRYVAKTRIPDIAIIKKPKGNSLL